MNSPRSPIHFTQPPVNYTQISGVYPDLSDQNVLDLQSTFETLCPKDQNQGIVGVMIHDNASRTEVCNRLIKAGVPQEKIIVLEHFNPDLDYIVFVADSTNINTLRRVNKDSRGDTVCVIVLNDKGQRFTRETAQVGVYPNMTPSRIAEELFVPLLNAIDSRNPPENSPAGDSPIDIARSHLNKGKILLHSNAWGQGGFEDFLAEIVPPFTEEGERVESTSNPQKALAMIQASPSSYVMVCSDDPNFLLDAKKQYPNICRILLTMHRYKEGTFYEAAGRSNAHAVLTQHHMPANSLATIIKNAYILLSQGKDLTNPDIDDNLKPEKYPIL